MARMNGAEEVVMLKEIALAEKLSHPSEDDERIIGENVKPSEEEPPSLCALNEPATSTSVLPILKQALPHVIAHLNFEDILRCRMVCSDVCEAVDQRLESNLEISPSTSSSATASFPQPSLFINCRIHSSPNGPHILEAIHLLDTETLKSFLAKMENHPRNPFIGRCVRFGNYGDTTHNSEYWDNVMELLRKFGQHIWHVELSDGHVTVPDPLTCYKLLRQCLLLLPNLKSLEVSFAHEDVSEEKLSALVKYLSENPMPSLEFLEKLDWNDHKASQIVQDLFIATFSQQLKALAAPMSVFYVEINELTFPNLETLYLTNVENNEYLVDLRWCKLPSLKKLYLNLGGERCTSCGDISNEIWNVKTVLLLVRQFQLGFLSLFLAPGSQLKGSRTLSVEEWKLDCLKSLEVQHCKDTSYEFLKCFTKLEHIHFFDIHHPLFPERERSESGEDGNLRKDSLLSASVARSVALLEEPAAIVKNPLELDKFVYAGKMYESNVWEVIPSLQIFTFKCVWDRQGKNLIAVNDWYRREVYEQIQRGRSEAGVVSKVVGFVRSMFSFS